MSIQGRELGPNVEWILQNSVDDINYRGAVPRLTDDELRYCLEHETRKTGVRLLRREARKRGLEVHG